MNKAIYTLIIIASLAFGITSMVRYKGAMKKVAESNVTSHEAVIAMNITLSELEECRGFVDVLLIDSGHIVLKTK